MNQQVGPHRCTGEQNGRDVGPGLAQPLDLRGKAGVDLPQGVRRGRAVQADLADLGERHAEFGQAPDALQKLEVGHPVLLGCGSTLASAGRRSRR
ncbi:hypothetical protein [Micromonospora sp. NPDC048898]|uniref:hypothetical protein n=1 Tax=Micromonospora sp. NPDC048898 TaxID=3364260 RepID=UPI0037128F61